VVIGSSVMGASSISDDTGGLEGTAARDSSPVAGEIATWEHGREALAPRV
jgi:hypothetical protein